MNLSTLNKTLSYFFLIIFSALVILFTNLHEHDSTLAFLDVSQGDAALVQYHGINILIDGGDRSSRYSNKSYLRKILSKKKIKNIDIIILSHPHADHLYGIVDFLEHNSTSLIIKSPITHTTKLYKNFLSIVQKKNIKMLEVTSGFSLSIGDNLQIKTLSPSNSFNINGLDNNSLVIMLIAGTKKFLFTGDIYSETEKWLVDTYKNKLRADYLKIPHHGSKTSSSKLFLQQVVPEISIISCGLNNRYGFPHQKTLKRIKKWSKKVHRTDQSGELTINL